MLKMLKRIKDKLYYYLAEKNWGVRREYGAYVDAHQEEHVKAPWKHWWLLIRLNWHYRILRKKTPLLSARELSVESEAFERPTAAQFAKDLSEYDVISFDIFDTLILRPFPQPSDLFEIVGVRLGIANFREIRINAERDARAEAIALNGNDEVTIYDIYKRVSKRTGIDMNAGVETELAAEKEYCFADPYMKEVYEILLDLGKEIVITSDMYIPHDSMEGLLSECGYAGYKKLYVSCDYRCSKHSGGLFERLVSEHKGRKIIHIGDNYVSDFESAKKSGIAAKLYHGSHLEAVKTAC